MVLACFSLTSSRVELEVVLSCLLIAMWRSRTGRCREPGVPPRLRSRVGVLCVARCRRARAESAISKEHYISRESVLPAETRGCCPRKHSFRAVGESHVLPVVALGLAGCSKVVEWHGEFVRQAQITTGIGTQESSRKQKFPLTISFYRHCRLAIFAKIAKNT